jgi:hypothetical protein
VKTITRPGEDKRDGTAMLAWRVRKGDRPKTAPRLKFGSRYLAARVTTGLSVSPFSG